jgi:outer membrane immunogenic protein
MMTKFSGGVVRKRTIIIAMLGALIGTSAFAAAMAIKVPPRVPAPAPVYSWTGFYIGGTVGAHGRRLT